MYREPQYTQRLLHLTERAHPCRDDGGLPRTCHAEEKRAVRDLARRNLDTREVEPIDEQVEALGIERRREELDTAPRAVLDERVVVGLAKFERLQHRVPRLLLAGRRKLIRSLGSRLRRERVGAEGLELHGVRPGVRRHVDQLPREVERTVVVNAGFGDDEVALIYSLSSAGTGRSWKCF